MHLRSLSCGHLASILLFVAMPARAYPPGATGEHAATQPLEAKAPGAIAEESPESQAASDAESSDSPLEGDVEKASITVHEMAWEGGTLSYRATAANMPMKDEAGTTKATVFFVAYERLNPSGAGEKEADDHDDADAVATPNQQQKTLAAMDPAARPLTFVFNGGPGAAAVWLHLGTAGPKRIALHDNGEVPPPPYRLVENESTWLGDTDLVFIDPVGTGFSRPAKDEKGEQFYGVREDLRWVGEFIRLYLTHYQRWASPLFLAGESYGTTRAAGLSEFLLDRYGIALNGLILISCALDFQHLQTAPSNDLPYILYLPTYTAAAWYHGKLGEALQGDLEAALNEAKSWAMGPYATALMSGRTLDPQRQRETAGMLSRYTSLPETYILRSDLRVEPSAFRKQLLTDREQILGRFDARILGYDPQPEAMPWPGHDPSLSQYLAVYSSTFNDYVRRELKYKSILPYEVLSDKVRPWDYGTEGMGYLSMTEELTDALIKNPHLRVMFASGYYDLATPFHATDYTIEHLDLSETLRKNLMHTYYEGGHMMYHNHAALVRLGEDVSRFIEKTIDGN
jgi:carboxypeptidase C (cathepsin A)